ncbi:MAG TPA: DegT/DnrJ/EryC1/StrS family aminotransferase [Cyclobacteriaceae bacterium]|jgi:dTDP-4-amino-4,6-dideoxygalactose transaminase
MNVPFVDLKAQYLSLKEEIDRSISDVLNECNFIGGKRVSDFENALSQLYESSHCVGVGNGTDAIFIALKALGIGPGDEVITSAVSWISTSETITLTGARPVFSDIHPEYYTLDPDGIESRITPRTRAIIPVHLYGQAAHIGRISEICKRHNLRLIEDCAQAHLTEEDGKKVGLFGDAGTLSFYPGKNLGAYGDAGAVITRNEDLAIRVRMLANHGALKKHEHMMEGLNSRLDTLQAAILSVKIRYLEKWTTQRIEHAARYTRLLQGVGDIQVPAVRSGTRHTFHLYVIRTQHRDALKSYLEAKGIQVSIHYPAALPNLPAYTYLGHKPQDFPVASRFQSEILSLPMYPELPPESIEYVCHTIKEFFAKNG